MSLAADQNSKNPLSKEINEFADFYSVLNMKII